MTFTTEQIANAIYNGCLLPAALDPDLDTLDAARKINTSIGWTVETDDRVYTHVRISDARLVVAHRLALSWD